MALAIQHVAHQIHLQRNHTMQDFRYRDELWEKLFLDALKNTSFEGVTVSLTLIHSNILFFFQLFIFFAIGSETMKKLFFFFFFRNEKLARFMLFNILIFFLGFCFFRFFLISKVIWNISGLIKLEA